LYQPFGLLVSISSEIDTISQNYRFAKRFNLLAKVTLFGVSPYFLAKPTPFGESPYFLAKDVNVLYGFIYAA